MVMMAVSWILSHQVKLAQVTDSQLTVRKVSVALNELWAVVDVNMLNIVNP